MTWHVQTLLDSPMLSPNKIFGPPLHPQKIGSSPSKASWLRHAIGSPRSVHVAWTIEEAVLYGQSYQSNIFLWSDWKYQLSIHQQRVKWQYIQYDKYRFTMWKFSPSSMPYIQEEGWLFFRRESCMKFLWWDTSNGIRRIKSRHTCNTEIIWVFPKIWENPQIIHV